MSPFEAYVTWLALQRHFQSEGYDFLKYRGKVKVNEDSFEVRKDRVMFDGMSRKSDPLQVMITALCKNKSAWIGDAYRMDEETKDRLGRIDSLRYNVKSELVDFGKNEVLKIMRDPHFIFSLLKKGDASLETIATSCAVIKPWKYWRDHFELDPLVSELSLQLRKYEPLIEYDRKSFTEWFKKNLQ